MRQYQMIRHDKEWKVFAHGQHLNLKRVANLSFVEYEYASTRTAYAAWERRSELASSAEESKAAFNAGLQRASELVYKLHGEAAARAVQGLKI